MKKPKTARDVNPQITQIKEPKSPAGRYGGATARYGNRIRKLHFDAKWVGTAAGLFGMEPSGVHGWACCELGDSRSRVSARGDARAPDGLFCRASAPQERPIRVARRS